MTKSPSTELHAVPEPEPAPDEPPWVDELRKRIAAIERRLTNIDGNLTTPRNAYRVQAQELQLLRIACPACDAEAPVAGTST